MAISAFLQALLTDQCHWYVWAAVPPSHPTVSLQASFSALFSIIRKKSTIPMVVFFFLFIVFLHQRNQYAIQYQHVIQLKLRLMLFVKIIIGVGLDVSVWWIRLLHFTERRTPSEFLSLDQLYLPSKIILLKALTHDLKEDVFSCVYLPQRNTENCPGSLGYTYAEWMN